MGKWVNPTVLDAALNQIKGTTFISVCSTGPVTRTEAQTTYKLAATTASLGGLSITAGTGTSARKISVPQYSNVNIDSSGTAQHVALYDASVLFYVTTCTAQGLTASNTVTIPTWNIEFSDPT